MMCVIHRLSLQSQGVVENGDNLICLDIAERKP